MRHRTIFRRLMCFPFLFQVRPLFSAARCTSRKLHAFSPTREINRYTKGTVILFRTPSIVFLSRRGAIFSYLLRRKKDFFLCCVSCAAFFCSLKGPGATSTFVANENFLRARTFEILSARDRALWELSITMHFWGLIEYFKGSRRWFFLRFGNDVRKC